MLSGVLALITSKLIMCHFVLLEQTFQRFWWGEVDVVCLF